MAKRFGMDADAFSHSYESSSTEQQEQPANPEQIIPDGVGEYVDYEELPSKRPTTPLS